MEVRCPTCHKMLAWKGNPFRPFCSERCRLLDLGKWLGGGYAIPAADDETEEPPDEGTGTEDA
jgi:endogenous inhibitor of DNA gyrase (YacG/DUF329 family)